MSQGSVNRESARRFMEEVFNKKSLDAAEELISDEFVEHDPFPGMPNDKKGVIEGLRMMFEAFPDMKATVQDIIAEGDRVCIHTTFSGTHKDEFMGIPATGKKVVDVENIDIVRIVDGKAVEHWGVVDQMAMMIQLGVMQPPAS